MESGYLYREGDVLYTKILVTAWQDRQRVFDISRGLRKESSLEKDVEVVAEKIAALIRRAVPDYLLKEWEFFDEIAGMPVLDSVI